MKQMMKGSLYFILLLIFIFWSRTTIAKWDNPDLNETQNENPYENPYKTLSPTLESTKKPDQDLTVLFELDQLDAGEAIEEAFDGEPILEDSIDEFDLHKELLATERSVSVRRVIANVLRDGDPFEIEATLVGFDEVEYELQWQYNDGSGWQNMPDAYGSTTVKLFADRYNVNYSWRILVTIT